MKALRKEIEDKAFYGTTDPVTWPAAVVAWSEAIRRTGKRPSTIDRYVVSLGQLRRWLDPVTVQAIDTALIRAIVKGRQRDGAGNATIRRDLSALSSVLDHALSEGLVEQNAARSYDRRWLQVESDPIPLPRPQAVAAVIALGTRFTDLAAFARLTGMREEEIAGLTHDQVDRARMAVTLTTTKGRRARQVPLSPQALAVIDRQPRHIKGKWVFWTGNGERFIAVSSRFYAMVRRVARKAAQPFPVFRFHDLRHLFAVEYLRERRGSIYELQMILGHASIRTTELYLSHLTPEEQHAAKFGVAQFAAHDQRIEGEKA